MYRVSLKKGTLVVLALFLFQKSDFTFSHVFWNQKFALFSSSHSNNTNLESKLPQNTRFYDLWGWIIIEMICQNCLSQETRSPQYVPLIRASRPVSTHLYHLSTFGKINHQNTVHLFFNWFIDLQSAKMP